MITIFLLGVGVGIVMGNEKLRNKVWAAITSKPKPKGDAK